MSYPVGNWQVPMCRCDRRGRRCFCYNTALYLLTWFIPLKINPFEVALFCIALQPLSSQWRYIITYNNDAYLKGLKFQFSNDRG